MSDRRSRPRIAGQRRTATASPAVDETPIVDEPTADETDVDDAQVDDTRADETQVDEAQEGVTPATPATAEPSTDPVEAQTKPPATTEGKRGLGTLLTAALAVVVVLTLTVAAVLGIKAWHGKQAEDARDQASAAGRKAAETALSYDYRDLDKSFAAARATMTPDFAAKFDETAKVAGQLATKTKATVKADVREVGVRDGDADRVTLIIFVNQTTTSTITQGKPRVDLNRTRFTMVRNGDRWLVQEIAGL
jgi:Mce-associated membrane protein